MQQTQTINQENTELPEEYTSLRIKVATKERLNKARHELYADSFDDAINKLIDLHEKPKK